MFQAVPRQKLRGRWALSHASSAAPGLCRPSRPRPATPDCGLRASSPTVQNLAAIDESACGPYRAGRPHACCDRPISPTDREVWESRADQELWMPMIGPALGQAGVAQPKRMEWLSLLGNISF